MVGSFRGFGSFFSGRSYLGLAGRILVRDGTLASLIFDSKGYSGFGPEHSNLAGPTRAAKS
jgi:hypothetical protein